MTVPRRLFVVLLFCAASSLTAQAQQPAQEPQIAKQPQDIQRTTPELSGQRPHYPAYRHWQVGDKMNILDWGRATPFHWEGQGLRTPPSGYEWRSLDGVFVLGTPTGAVISVVPVNHKY